MIELTLIAGLAGFYMINLALGFYQGRNVRTASTYIFGHRYSTGVLLLTLTGTFVGSQHLTFWLRSAPRAGGSLFLLSIPFLLITGLWAVYYVFPKLRSFKHWYTLGDIVRQAYGSKHAQLAVEGISAVSSVLLLSAQLVALKRILPLLGIANEATLQLYALVIVFALVVIAYASRSGTPGVVSTDVLQMVLILGGTALIAYKVLNLELEHIRIQGLRDLWNQAKSILSDRKVTYFFIYNHPSFIRRMLAQVGYGLLLFSPAFIKRVGMASDNRQLKHSVLGFIMVFGVFMLMIVISGFGLFVAHGKVFALRDIYVVLLKVLSNSLWMKLLLLSMFMAAVMSTADSILTAASLCAVRMLMILQAKEKKVAEPSLRKLRMANIVVGVIALVLAFLFMHRRITDFLVLARSILAGLLPCLVGISLGIKKSSKALLGSMACFGLLFVGSMILPHLLDISFLQLTKPVSSIRHPYKPLLPFVILLSIVAYLVFEAIVHKGLKWESSTSCTEKKSKLLDTLDKKTK